MPVTARVNGLDALVWAQRLGGNATFGSLPEGQHFRFPDFPTLYRKARGGWYRDVKTGRTYRTGGLTAVRMCAPSLPTCPVCTGPTEAAGGTGQRHCLAATCGATFTPTPSEP